MAIQFLASEKSSDLLCLIWSNLRVVEWLLQYSSNFLKVLISTANAPGEGSPNAKFVFKGTSPSNHFSTDR